LALFIQGMGVFPGIKRPRVLWIGLGGEVEALRQLNSRIEDELAGLGFARENRGFKAHLTLARFKEGVASRDLLQAFEALGNYTPEPFAAKHLVLYKSDLRPQGALYTPLAEVLLDQDRR
jgi:2'-5' RNA ligase